MSDEHSSDNESDRGVSMLGNALAIITPISMILMLAITGIAFVLNIRGDAEATKSDAPAASATDAASPAAAPAAGGKSAIPEGIDPAVYANGKASFALCGACHGVDGKGLKVGPMLMAPTLVGSEIVLGDPDKMALVILKGIKKETPDFMGVMAPLQLALDDEKLAAVMTYSRNAFGNSAPAVSVEVAKKARERFAELVDPTGVSRTKLDEVLAAHK